MAVATVDADGRVRPTAPTGSDQFVQFTATPAGQVSTTDLGNQLTNTGSALPPKAPSPADAGWGIPGQFTLTVPRGGDLSPAELADRIRSDPAWGRQPITLISTGAGTPDRLFAAELAKRLPGVLITAPDGMVWVGNSGRAYSGGLTVGGDGRIRPDLRINPDDNWRQYLFRNRTLHWGERLNGYLANPNPGALVRLRDNRGTEFGVAFPGPSLPPGSWDGHPQSPAPMVDSQGRVVGASYAEAR